MRIRSAVLILVLGSFGVGAEPFPKLSGPLLGQGHPPAVPTLFAPGIVNTGLFTRDLVVSPDGTELYFSILAGGFKRATVVGTRLVGGRWTEPEVASFASDPRWRTLEPCISPDGKSFYFASDRPRDPAKTTPGPFGIWVMERDGKGWGAPRPLPDSINGHPAFFPSVTASGTLYFTREEEGRKSGIWRARRGPTGFLEPQRLPVQVNAGTDRYNAWISPDESLLLLGVEGAKDSLGGTDYYAVFRNSEDQWSEPMNLGDRVNTPGNDEYSACLSPDGKAFFFMSGRKVRDPFPSGTPLSLKALRATAMEAGVNGNPTVQWMDAGFLEALRVKAVFRR